MAYELLTKHGYNMYDMRSMLQKAIRRGDVDRAAYAANEMYEKYTTYTWKTLLTVSAEDCYGIMTKEIVALQQADDYVNKGKKGDDRGTIFIAKAVTLLCLARKNRDADYVACNFMYPDRELDPDEIDETPLEDGKLENGRIPDYVFDCHTREGKKRGKTRFDMLRDENEALNPHQYSMFDNEPWTLYYEDKERKGRLQGKERRQVEEDRARRQYAEAHGRA